MRWHKIRRGVSKAGSAVPSHPCVFTVARRGSPRPTFRAAAAQGQGWADGAAPAALTNGSAGCLNRLFLSIIFFFVSLPSIAIFARKASSPCFFPSRFYYAAAVRTAGASPAPAPAPSAAGQHRGGSAALRSSPARGSPAAPAAASGLIPGPALMQGRLLAPSPRAEGERGRGGAAARGTAERRRGAEPPGAGK